MVMNLHAKAGEASLIPGLGRSLEEDMASHSSILAWRISWTWKPGGLQSIGLQKLDTTEVTSWRRQWHPTPVLLPGKSHGRRSLGGCSPWGRQESDMTEQLHFQALEKEMATHSSVLSWKIPGIGKPGGLRSMGSHRVGHD